MKAGMGRVYQIYLKGNTTSEIMNRSGTLSALGKQKTNRSCPEK